MLATKKENRMLDMSTKWMCKIFGHNMFLITNDVGGGAKCIRCGYTTPAIKWPRPEKGEK